MDIAIAIAMIPLRKFQRLRLRLLQGPVPGLCKYTSQLCSGGDYRINSVVMAMLLIHTYKNVCSSGYYVMDYACSSGFNYTSISSHAGYCYLKIQTSQRQMSVLSRLGQIVLGVRERSPFETNSRSHGARVHVCMLVDDQGGQRRGETLRRRRFSITHSWY